MAAILNLPVGDEDQTVDAAEAVADDEAAAGLEAVAAAATVAGRAWYGAVYVPVTGYNYGVAP